MAPQPHEPVYVSEIQPQRCDSAVELATSPFQPWLLKHVMGKFSARAMKDVDEAFRRRLETKLVTVEYEAEPFEVPEAYRRAA